MEFPSETVRHHLNGRWEGFCSPMHRQPTTSWISALVTSSWWRKATSSQAMMVGVSERRGWPDAAECFPSFTRRGRPKLRYGPCTSLHFQRRLFLNDYFLSFLLQDIISFSLLKLRTFLINNLTSVVIQIYSNNRDRFKRRKQLWRWWTFEGEIHNNYFYAFTISKNIIQVRHLHHWMHQI